MNLKSKLMIFLTCSYRLKRILWLSVALLGSGCSGLLETPATPFDPTEIGSMRFNFGQITLASALPEQAIARRVAANLAEWGYPVFADGEDYSHVLEIDIEPVKHGSTPVGFSFSAGNSDPRALDFQKSDVIPVTCAVMPRDRTEQRAEMTMDFIADDYSGFAEMTRIPPELIDMLIDDISTVCFNLLDSLKVKTVSTEQSGNTNPGWIPEIRLEIENGTDGATESAPDLAEPPTDQPPQVFDSPRKRIVIHNQGSPVIFKFGHERQ